MRIYLGLNKPAVARGQNQCRTLEFAFFNRGLHSYLKSDRAAKKAIVALAAKGILIHHPETTQFQWNENFGK